MTAPVRRSVVADPSRDTDWATQARCRKANPELWFPIGYTREYQPQVRRAIAECHQCPVEAECLAWALACGQPDGIWGGKTPSQRRPRSMRDAP